MYVHSLSDSFRIPKRAVRDRFVMLRYPTRMPQEPKRLRDLDDAERLATLEELVELTRRGHVVAAGFRLEVLAGVEEARELRPPAPPWGDAAR